MATSSQVNMYVTLHWGEGVTVNLTCHDMPLISSCPTCCLEKKRPKVYIEFELLRYAYNFVFTEAISALKTQGRAAG